MEIRSRSSTENAIDDDEWNCFFSDLASRSPTGPTETRQSRSLENRPDRPPSNTSVDLDSDASFVEELLQHSREMSNQVNLADAGRSQSESDESVAPPVSKTSDSLSPSPCANLRTSSWWAQLLKRHARDLGHADPCPAGCPTKTLVSGCSGIFAEGEALKEPGTSIWQFSEIFFEI